MSRIPQNDDEYDPTDDNESPFLDDTEYDDHYHELDFDPEYDPFELDDDAVEDEQDYGLDP